jgi:carbon-monoxide dehydrogenase small subunit
MVRIRFNLNGKDVEADVPPNTTLLNMLRNDFGLTSVKKGCEVGECGACTILLDGVPVNSCMVLAPKVSGRKVVSVEGLLRDGELHPLQKAFIEENALQCGFCTPGFILTAKALLDEVKKPTVEQVKEALSGNLCRCGAYHMITKAVLKAAETSK